MKSKTSQVVNPAYVVRLVGIGVAISLLGDMTFYLVLPTEYAKAGILASQIGIMLSANRIIRIFLNTPLGELIEHLPRRWMLIPALTLGGFSSLMYTIPGFWPLLIGRMMWGACWSGLYLAATTAILDVATDDTRGWLIGRFQMWFFIGIGSSSLLGGLLFDNLGYAPTFYVSAMIMFSIVILWWFFLPETRDYHSHTQQNQEDFFVADAQNPESDNATDSGESTASSQPSPMPSPYPVILAIAMHGLNWLVFIGGGISLMPVLMKERVGSELALFGLLVLPHITYTGLLNSSNTIISMISSPISGRMTDRSGNRWQVVTIALMIGTLSSIMAAVGYGFFAVLSTMLMAILSGILTTQLTAVVGDYARLRHQHYQQNGNGEKNLQGRMLGIMNTAGDIGGAAGPLLVFYLLPRIHLSGIYVISAMLAIMAIPFVWQASRQVKASPQMKVL